ncbi:MAG: RNA-directed DNA polymerase, partial [Rhodospirillaceae bacterium]|nr:RNA-directed DNA polymerase [Rhodospirillaceae bacterium]
MKPRRLAKKEFLSCLIATAYFPDEVPPVLTAHNFSQYCRNDYSNFEPEQGRLGRLNTNYETYTVPRTVEGRRNLAIVNPLAQLGLSLAITINKKAIGDIIHENGRTLYSIESDKESRKAFSGLQFEKREEMDRKVLSVSDYVLKADISRFFYTIYTHSISWAILGKEKTKDLFANDRQALRRHWSTKIDMSLQACQSRETFGVPVGPDTSRIIAELILAEVEKDDAFAQLVDGQPATRLLDDFLIGFDSESEAFKALGALRSALWKFNLQLNEDKTCVARSKTIHRERWKLEFEKAYISDDSAERQSR